jgi:hypothetical protein
MSEFEIQAIEDDIIAAFKTPLGKKEKKVYIESGAANDEVIDYELNIRETSRKRERAVSFKTSGSIFPKVIKLTDYENVELEEYNGNLFIHVY